jgi:uncharacterized protein
MYLSSYVKIYPSPERPGHTLLYSTRRSAVVEISDAALLAVREGKATGRESETLARLGFLVQDPAAERTELRELFVVANRKRKLFSAIVVLNLDCNLACDYCYEDAFRGRHYMSQETADLVVETVQREQIAAGRDVTLTFYGGEPLLSLPHIRDISRRLRAAALAQGTGFDFSLVTNGTLLTRSVAEELTALGFKGAKVTLDGPKELHDQSRPYVSGNGSFDAIVSNIRAVCDLAPLQLGGNYTRGNYRAFPQLLDHLQEEGITPDKIHSVLFTPIIPKSGLRRVTDFNTGCACNYAPWLQEASLFLREETLKRGFPAPKPRLSACMVEFDSDLVINFDGSLYKCPAFMGYEELRIGTLGKPMADYRASHNMDVWKNDDCLECAYLPICFGGCRQITLLRNGAIDTVDCRRELLDATLETIVRQDLKYQATKK